MADVGNPKLPLAISTEPEVPPVSHEARLRVNCVTFPAPACEMPDWSSVHSSLLTKTRPCASAEENDDTNSVRTAALRRNVDRIMEVSRRWAVASKRCDVLTAR